MPERQYVPKANVRAKQTQFGEVLTVGFSVKELIEFAEMNKSERGYLNLCIVPRKTPNEYATHSIYLDDYKPGARGQQQRSAPTPRAKTSPDSEPPAETDYVPF